MYISSRDLLPLINAARRKQNHPPYKNFNGPCSILNRHKCPSWFPDDEHQMWHAETALYLLTHSFPGRKLVGGVAPAVEPPPTLPAGNYRPLRKLLPIINTARATAGLPPVCHTEQLQAMLHTAQIPHLRYHQHHIYNTELAVAHAAQLPIPPLARDLARAAKEKARAQRAAARAAKKAAKLAAKEKARAQRAADRAAKKAAKEKARAAKKITAAAIRAAERQAQIDKLKADRAAYLAAKQAAQQPPPGYCTLKEAFELFNSIRQKQGRKGHRTVRCLRQLLKNQHVEPLCNPLRTSNLYPIATIRQLAESPRRAARCYTEDYPTISPEELATGAYLPVSEFAKIAKIPSTSIRNYGNDGQYPLLLDPVAGHLMVHTATTAQFFLNRARA